MSLLDKVKDAATKATEQAKQGVDAAKDKIEETKARKQLDETFESIGRLVVQQRHGTAPEDAAAQIDAAIAKVAELETQIEEHASTPNVDSGDALAGGAGDGG
ncbi:MAG TPA: hypothetical protein VGO03_15105 [Acidimicrobiia bacterium]|jgi:predicted ATPase